MKKVFIMTGETSGDVHAGMLVNAVKNLNNEIDFYGVGGENLKKENVKLLYNYKDFACMGIIEPLLKLRFYKNALQNIYGFILSKKINSVILVDFPGFNLRLAEKLKKNNIKIIYYISPQIWAWHYSRIKKIKKYIDAMIVLYPFEEEIYRREGVRAFFTGNPLIDIVKEKSADACDIAVKPANIYIGLLPGSRLSEVKLHLPAMLDAAILIKEKYNTAFLLPVAKKNESSYIKEILDKPQYKTLKIQLIFNNTYKAINKCDFIIISSGTATLETAILGKPMIVIYKVDILSELLAKLVLKVKNIALVNIVAGKKICPELLQRNVTGKTIFVEVSKYLDNKNSLKEMIAGIRKVKNILGKSGAIQRIAKIVISLIND
ncbi:MAG: lipid-A-disaccharide synthase [Spirochaetes bacterium]|nr:lipid-A-disaccharide synthase [Spirochaetota bacterium]